MADLGKDLGKSIEETVDAYQTNKEVTSTTLASIEGSLVIIHNTQIQLKAVGEKSVKQQNLF